MRQAWLAALVVLACATSASAADTEGARKKFFVGAALFEDGEYGDALPYLEKAIELDPGFCRVHYYLAKSYHETGSDRARASAEAYKDCATDGEQADANALLALIPATAAATSTSGGSGGGSSSSDEDRGSRRWEDDEEETIVARYEAEDTGGRRRWEDDEDDAGSSRGDEDEDDDAGSSSRDDDEDEGGRWGDDEGGGGRWDDDEGDDEDDEAEKDDDSDSYDDEDDDKGGAYNASASTDAGATYEGPSAAVALKRRRTAGGVMMGVGAGVAVGGFVMSYAMYSKYYWESDTGLYNWSRNVNIAGFAVGVAGAAIAGTGLLLAILPDGSKRTAAIVPGPVTTVTFAF